MIRFTNTLSKKKEKFVSIEPKKVKMYNCGPTVYDYVHIGNLRSFLLADLIRRFLEKSGYDVFQVMNITDVGHAVADADVGEDKVGLAAERQGKTPQEISQFYSEAFFKDIDQLNFRRAHVYPKASEHIGDMIAMISKLLERGHAYLAGGNVYYDVATFPKYGQLSGNSIAALNPGARIEVRDEKKQPADFALWITSSKQIMQWPSPWGVGYPGWHIECSAMSNKYLGSTFDIHSGGEDNKFPHHECEIAQSEGATGLKFVNYWLHGTHMLVNGERMGKSLGNFYRLDDLLNKGYEARAVRLFLLSTHYRQQLNFTFLALDSAQNSLIRLDTVYALLTRYDAQLAGRKVTWPVKFTKRFLAALGDDLNISEALAVVFEAVKLINEKIASRELTEHERLGALQFFNDVGDVLGVSFKRQDEIPESVKTLLVKRELARKEKRFQEADELRLKMEELGFGVEDTPTGAVVRKV